MQKTCFNSLLVALMITVGRSSQPNPPTWPSGVYIFDPNDPVSAQKAIDEAFANNGGTYPDTNGEFSSDRYAFLLKPGGHEINIELGFYTTVHGMGMIPTDTLISEISVADSSPNCTLSPTLPSKQNFFFGLV